MNLRRRDLDAVKVVIAQARDAARAVTIVTRKPRARVVLTSLLVGVIGCILAGIREKSEVDLAHHPVERAVGKTVIGVSAANVGMHAGKPDLFETCAGL